MKEYNNINEAYKEISELKEDYDYYRKYQTKLKQEYSNCLKSKNSINEEDSFYDEIYFNREKLKFLENEIKEVRKAIKKLNKEQNAKNNIQRHK